MDGGSSVSVTRALRRETPFKSKQLIKGADRCWRTEPGFKWRLYGQSINHCHGTLIRVSAFNLGRGRSMRHESMFVRRLCGTCCAVIGVWVVGGGILTF